jgi:hypothetical protein
VHFYSNFRRKSRSNRGTPSELLPRARSRACLPRASAAHLGIRATRAPSLGVAPSRGSTHAEEPRSPRCPSARAPKRAPAVRPRPCPCCPAVLAAARAASPCYPYSRVAYKERLPPGRDAQATPPQPSRPPASSRAAAASSNSDQLLQTVFWSQNTPLVN